jgi:regulator of sigma E protease
METIFNILTISLSFFVLISVIVGIHELGHFMAARYFGIYVLRFKIGFGKTFFKWFDKKNTEFALGILPLGGYVQMLGEDLTTKERNDLIKSSNNTKFLSYKDVSLGARAVVTAAGPFANFVLAVVAYFFISLMGTKDLAPIVGGVEENSLASIAELRTGDRILLLDKKEVKSFSSINTLLASRMGETGFIEISYLPYNSNVSKTSIVEINNWLYADEQKSPVSKFGISPYIPALVASLQKGGPAEIAGIIPGDVVIEIDGVRIKTWQNLSSEISDKFEKEISIIVERSNQELTFKFNPIKVVTNSGIERGVIGVQRLSSLDDLPEEFIVINKENFLGALAKAFSETYKFTVLILDSIKKMVTGSVSVENIGGPIQISMLAGSAAKAGFVSFLTILAVLSINLGIINLLPIPILDGGQLVMIALEKIKGSPISDSFLEYSFRLGILLLGSLMVFAIFNDIARVV